MNKVTEGELLFLRAIDDSLDWRERAMARHRLIRAFNAYGPLLEALKALIDEQQARAATLAG